MHTLTELSQLEIVALVVTIIVVAMGACFLYWISWRERKAQRQVFAVNFNARMRQQVQSISHGQRTEISTTLKILPHLQMMSVWAPGLPRYLIHLLTVSIYLDKSLVIMGSPNGEIEVFYCEDLGLITTRAMALIIDEIEERKSLLPQTSA